MKNEVIEVRPYQLMCLICRTGRRNREKYYFEDRLDSLTVKIRENINRPLLLACNCISAYAWQNPGREYDTPEGQEFNDRRDLAVLRDLNMVPGTAQPASDIIRKIFKHIKTCDDICALGKYCTDKWQECKFAEFGNYERGIAAGEKKIIPPCRPAAELASCKQMSAAQLYQKRQLQVRPHHLACIACIVKGRKPCEMEPLDADNACEIADIIQKNPDIPVELVSGPCMVCPPCAGYSPEHNICNAGIGMGLRDEKKDLDALMLLGMKFGDILPGGKLYEKLFTVLDSTKNLCGRGHSAAKVDEWVSCGSDGNDAYLRSRAVKLHIYKKGGHKPLS
ncbi:MAG: hypothetical protein PHV82_02495 [Victivallaceae bacterium]|nr:hypothetical protein [Victivallaceae bacterium]